MAANADGSGLRVIHRCDANCPYHFAWSPDGSKIFYTNGWYLSWIPPAGGTGTVFRKCENACQVFDGGLSFSPDGRWLAVSGYDKGFAGGIYIVALRTRAIQRITWCFSKPCLGGSRDANPVWSPDGSTILFTREFNLWTVHPDGSGLHRLTDCPATDVSSSCVASNPVWSPDGSRIAFIRGHGSVAIMGRDGTGLRMLTHNEPASPVQDCCLSWQPDPSPAPRPVVFAGFL